MHSIVTLVGGPVGSASSSALIGFAHRITRRAGIHTSSIVIGNLPIADLQYGRQESHVVQSARALLDQADGLIFVTPIRGTASAELRKAYVDLLPQNALRNKVILPVVTGISPDHHVPLDYSAKLLLAGFGACDILRGISVSEADVRQEHGGLLRLDEQVEYGLRKALSELIYRIRQPQEADLQKVDLQKADLLAHAFRS